MIDLQSLKRDLAQAMDCDESDFAFYSLGKSSLSNAKTQLAVIAVPATAELTAIAHALQSVTATAPGQSDILVVAHDEAKAYQRKGNPVFVPTPLGAKIGRDIKERVEATVVFDPFFYHFRPGGHVAALHVHREHHYFARIDIEQFFYSVSRSVVQRALRDAGILKAQSFSKWSCVKNPYGDPAYSLPYGFVQSPILSTLVIMSSAIGAFLRALDPQVTATVYMDDISLSSNNQGALGVAFTGLLEALETAHFRPNLAKTKAPTETIELFNCKLQQGLTAVRESRRDEFYDTPKSPASEAAFEQYCASVEEGNF